MTGAVGMREIERIFEILDRRGISREAVVIPLRPSGEGQVRPLPDGRWELVVSATEPFEEWLARLDGALDALGAGSGE